MIDDPWRIVHRFRKITLTGDVRPITCPECDGPVTFLPGVDDEPVLWCTMEDTTYSLGTATWSDMQAVVNEYYLE